MAICKDLLTFSCELKKNDDRLRQKVAIEQPSLLSLAVLRVCEFLTGPGNTRKGANLEIILLATLQANRVQHGRLRHIPLWIGTEQKKSEVLVPEKMHHTREVNHGEISWGRAQNSHKTYLSIRQQPYPGLLHKAPILSSPSELARGAAETNK